MIDLIARAYMYYLGKPAEFQAVELAQLSSFFRICESAGICKIPVTRFDNKMLKKKLHA